MTAKTVESHRTNIMRKLELHSVAEWVLYAVRNGIVQVHGPAVLRFPARVLTERQSPLRVPVQTKSSERCETAVLSWRRAIRHKSW